ncbi:MAG: hypothetical protein EOM40_16020 [Clostridia bacterium]|nr:hypothetical protein [Clostridia bacterium]NCC42812.1 hypothetical protein [Clostridia bacterium]
MDLILEKELVLTAQSSKTNVAIPFSVQEDYQALRIEFEYGPKVVEDPEMKRTLLEMCAQKYMEESERPGKIEIDKYKNIVNLITVSLDYEDHYLGCAHRQDPVQVHRITPDGSSPGFFDCNIEQGEYRIVLNVHSITGKEVTCRVKVYGEGGTESDRISAI